MIERAKIQSIIDRLKKNSRIDKSFCSELDRSFDAQTLVIGVVGRMKAGKSSLVNAVAFEDEILPSAEKTTTVTLTEITYSENERIIVEFMSSQDIEDLKCQATYTGDDNTLKLKAKAALDTLERFKSGYENYLNQSKQITLPELPKYVDAEGDYSGLAKSVKIFINNEKLKGVTIVDTPGFNDPIVSRGETTKKALSKCHVLLFVHNKDGYDESDMNLLAEQIEYAGISEIIDILNKVDMLGVPIEEWPDELDYFIQKRDEMEMPNNNVKTLLSNAHSTFVSSLMALCGLISYDKMSEAMKCHYSIYEEEFKKQLCQESTRELQQQAFVKYSNVNSVIAEINRLAKEGSVYLVEGPLMTLKGKLSSIKNIIESEIEAKRAELDSLKVSIEVSRNSLTNFNQFMNSVINGVRASSLSLDLSNLVMSSIRKAQNLRQSESSKEFTEKRYTEPDFISRGVTKANIANYNTFVSGFENCLRDILNNLKDSFSSRCKNEINSLITSLSANSQIDKERMEWLKKSLIKSLLSVVNKINAIIPSKRLKSLPNGDQKQWDKLRTYFLDVYNDEYLSSSKDGIFLCFSEVSQNMDYEGIALVELNQLRNEINASMNKSPQKKREEIEKIENKIKVLEEELGSINSDIASIEELTNNVKSDI